jgi:hypothetical protein
MLEALAGVDVSAVRRAAEPTGVTVALARPGDRAILTALGALASFTADDVPDSLLTAARWVHVTSPVPAAGARRRRDRRAGGGHDLARPGLGSAGALGAGVGGLRRGDAQRSGGRTALRSSGPGGGASAGGERACSGRQGGRSGSLGGRPARPRRCEPGRHPPRAGSARGYGRRHRRGRLVRRGLHHRAARGRRPRDGARARLRVRRAEHAGGGRHGRAADARRGAYLRA